MSTETFDFLPEPLRTIARNDASTRRRLLRVWGTVAGLGGTGLVAWLGYQIARRASFGGGAHVRSAEAMPLAAGLVLFALGVLFFGSTWGADPAAAKLRKPGAKIVGCDRVLNGGGRFLSLKLGDGTTVLWRFGETPDRKANAAAEVAALAAVRRLPQWAGEK